MFPTNAVGMILTYPQRIERESEVQGHRGLEKASVFLEKQAK
jgi:hypothetical protein